MSGNLTNCIYCKNFISKGPDIHSKGSHPNSVRVDCQKSV